MNLFKVSLTAAPILFLASLVVSVGFFYGAMVATTHFLEWCRRRYG